MTTKGKKNDVEAALRTHLARVHAEDLLDALLAEHRAEVSAARDAALEEVWRLVDDLPEHVAPVQAAQRIRALQSAPAQVVPVAKVLDATFPPSCTADVVNEYDGGYREGVEKAMKMVRKRLGLLLDAEGESDACPHRRAWSEQCAACGRFLPSEGVTGHAKGAGEKYTGARGCACNGAPHAQEPGGPGYEPAPVVPDSMLDAECPVCHLPIREHANDGRYVRQPGTGVVCFHAQAAVYNEPAHAPTPGTCKGCDAKADAPSKAHRFSCTVYGKRQVKLPATRDAAGGFQVVGAAREWHGCSDPSGHSFSDGVCSTCGMDLRR